MNLEAIGPFVAASLFGLVSGFNDGGNLMGSFYRHQKNSADRTDRAADEISVIVIKHSGLLGVPWRNKRGPSNCFEW